MLCSICCKKFQYNSACFLKVAYWSKGDFHVAFDYKAFEGAI